MTTIHMPSLAEFKRFSKDIAPAARAVLMARVFAEMERERVDAYIKPIFESYVFQYDPKWAEEERHGYTGRITDIKYLYLADLESPEYKHFLMDCDDAHKAHGSTLPTGHCPALHAEWLLTQTEQALIKLAEPLFGIEHIYGDDRKRYLELLIGAALKAEKE